MTNIPTRISMVMARGSAARIAKITPGLGDIYQSSRQQLEQDLHHSRTDVRMQIELAGRQYRYAIWHGQLLPDQLRAFDTETMLIQDREVPQLAPATVYGDRGSSCFIHPDLKAYLVTTLNPNRRKSVAGAGLEPAQG